MRVLVKGGKAGNFRKKQRCIHGRCEALSSLCPSQISSHQVPIRPLAKTPSHPSIPRAPGGGTYPGYGAEGLVHAPVPFAHGDVTPFSSHCLLTAVKVCEEKGSGSAQTKSWNIFLIKLTEILFTSQPVTRIPPTPKFHKESISLRVQY